MKTIERRPFTGRCQGEVSNKKQRRFYGGTDYICRRFTSLIVNGEWRCSYHLGTPPHAFLVTGVFVEEASA